MSKKYNVAVIGYGWAATAHTPQSTPPARQVTAVLVPRENSIRGVERKNTDRHPHLHRSRRDARRTRHPRCRYHQLSRSACGPVIAAAKGGKHIIVEKRSRSNGRDRRDERAADESGVKVCVCFECRWSSQFIGPSHHRCRTRRNVALRGDRLYHGIGPWYGQYRWNTKKGARRAVRCSPPDATRSIALLLCMAARSRRSPATPRKARIPSSPPTNIHLRDDAAPLP